MPSLLATLLVPVSHGFDWAVRARRRLYVRGVLPSRRLTRPVLSVGNLVVGGVGKTPMTTFLARQLQERGHRVAILSRGYRRQSRGMVVVSNGEVILTTATTAGDEPFLMASDLPGVMVLVDADRGRAGAHAIEQLGATVLLLDDGFQHLRLQRDLDLVLVEASADLDAARVLPSGRYREAPSALERADIVLITRAHQVPDLGRLRAQVARYAPKASVVAVETRARDLVDQTGSVSPVEELAGRSVLALSSIGSPGQFEEDVRRTGAVVADTFRFPDHHRYRDEDMKRIAERVSGAAAEVVVTTTKDMVRLAGLDKNGVDLRALRSEAVLIDGAGAMQRIVSAAESKR